MTKELPHPQDFAAELSKELFTTIMSRPVTGARPRKAATLILIDRAGPTPRVLMGKRHEAHKFMPGKFVFPGGRIEPGDGRIASASELDHILIGEWREQLDEHIDGAAGANTESHAIFDVRQCCAGCLSFVCVLSHQSELPKKRVPALLRALHLRAVEFGSQRDIR